MYRRLLTDSKSAWAQTVAEVQAFFEFNFYVTPPVFPRWLGRVFGTEVEFLEERMLLGLVSRPPIAWGEIAAALAELFRREIEGMLSQLREEASPLQDSELPSARQEQRPDSRFTSYPSPPDAEFSYDNDYRIVWVNGEKQTLGPKRAIIVKMLHKAHERGEPGVPTRELLRAIGKSNKNAKLRDSFRKGASFHPLWGTLIVQAGHGFYRLNLR